MNVIAHKARVLLIDVGKMLPFLVCFVVVVSYIECLYSLLTQDYVVINNFVYLKKPISWQLGKVFEYNIQIIIVLAILSFAIKTCKWNKLAIVYLAFQLIEKSYFATHQWNNENYYYIVLAINILICLFLVIKGIRNL